MKTKMIAPAWALFPLRLMIGFGFLAHGLAKWSRGPANFAKLLHQIGTPSPGATAWAVTLLEVFGGLALIVGAFVFIVSIPLIVSMLVAMFTVQIHYGFSSVNTIGLTPSGPVFGPPGYEINLLYIAGLLAIALAGPTRFSLDRLRAHTAPRDCGRTSNTAFAGPATAPQPGAHKPPSGGKGDTGHCSLRITL